MENVNLNVNHVLKVRLNVLLVLKDNLDLKKFHIAFVRMVIMIIRELKVNVYLVLHFVKLVSPKSNVCFVKKLTIESLILSVASVNANKVIKKLYMMEN